MDSNELRSEKRRKLYYYLDVIRLDNNEIIGKLVDLTTGGFLITSLLIIPDGATLKLKIKFPQPVGNLEGLVFNAEKMWSKPDLNPEYNLIGFKTKDVSEKDLKYLEFLIERYSFHN